MYAIVNRFAHIHRLRIFCSSGNKQQWVNKNNSLRAFLLQFFYVPMTFRHFVHMFTYSLFLLSIFVAHFWHFCGCLILFQYFCRYFFFCFKNCCHSLCWCLCLLWVYMLHSQLHEFIIRCVFHRIEWKNFYEKNARITINGWSNGSKNCLIVYRNFSFYFSLTIDSLLVFNVNLLRDDFRFVFYHSFHVHMLSLLVNVKTDYKSTAAA